MQKLFALITGLLVLFTFANCSKDKSLNTEEEKALPGLFAFNVLTSGSLSLTKSKIAGRAGAQGNVNLTEYEVGWRLPGSNTRCDLIASGELHFFKGAVRNGLLCATGKVDLAEVELKREAMGKPDTDLDQLLAVSSKYSALWNSLPSDKPASDLNPNKDGSLSLYGDNADYNVFTLSADQFRAIRFLSLSLPSSSRVVVNVTGSTLDVVKFGMKLGQLPPSRILFNFAEAETVNLSSVSLRGSILATRAVVKFGDGVVEGSVIAKSVEGNGRFENSPFEAINPRLRRQKK